MEKATTNRRLVDLEFHIVTIAATTGSIFQDVL